MSADGRYVVFDSEATDLVAGIDANGSSSDVFVRDLVAGTTRFVSLRAAGDRSANDESDFVSMSRDERYVSFFSFATDLVLGFVDGNGTYGDTFVRDLVAGQTQLVSINASGTASGNSFTQTSAVSNDGAFVAFDSAATDLVSISDPGNIEFFLRNLNTQQTSLISVDNTGTMAANGDSGGIASQLTAALRRSPARAPISRRTVAATKSTGAIW